MESIRRFSPRGGLGPALKSLGRRSKIPVVIDGDISRRLPDHIEVAAYFVASEAIANAVKHSGGSLIRARIADKGKELEFSNLR
jgi:signal transduction histidine kinase